MDMMTGYCLKDQGKPWHSHFSKNIPDAFKERAKAAWNAVRRSMLSWYFAGRTSSNRCATRLGQDQPRTLSQSRSFSLQAFNDATDEGDVLGTFLACHTRMLNKHQH
eukprot:4062843-Prymnesium_polylepis.1